MTELLDRAVAQVRTLTDAEQDAVASVLMAALAPEQPPPLDEETRAAIRNGVSQANRGDYASDAEIDAMWSRRDL